MLAVVQLAFDLLVCVGRGLLWADLFPARDNSTLFDLSIFFIVYLYGNLLELIGD